MLAGKALPLYNDRGLRTPPLYANEMRIHLQRKGVKPKFKTLGFRTRSAHLLFQLNIFSLYAM